MFADQRKFAPLVGLAVKELLRNPPKEEDEREEPQQSAIAFEDGVSIGKGVGEGSGQAAEHTR